MMSNRFPHRRARRSAKRVLWLLVLVGCAPRLVLSQATLPNLDSPFVVPPATPNAVSPFQDEAIPAKPMDGRSALSTGVLNHLFSHQWVHTDVDGSLRGTVVALAGQDTLFVSGIKVMLIQRERTISTVESNAEGQIEFRNVLPGYYSIVAEADNSFAAFGLAVIDEVNGSHLPDSVEVRVIRPKTESIRRMLNVDMVPMQLSETDQQIVSDPISTQRVFARSHRVLSSKEGRVVGHLSQLGIAPELVDMSEMKAMLLKDGEEVGRSNVTRDGAFEFQGVAPGCYGFTAAGNRGIAAVAFCVVSPDSLTEHPKSKVGERFVAAFQENAEPELNVELADGADVMSIQESQTSEEEVLEEELPLAQPMPLGGSNMFGAGQVIPGGGSGMGSSLGSLAGLGALGAIAYVIANENDDEDEVVSPIVIR